MIRRIHFATFGVIFLMLVAGCGGVGNGQTTTQTPTTATSAIPTTEQTTTTEATTTSEPTTQRTTVPEAQQNPWGKEIVTIALTFDEAVDDPERHREYLKDAVKFWNGHSDEYTAHKVRFAIEEDPPADISINVGPTIEECGDQVTNGSFGYCTDTYEEGEEANVLTDVRVAARYEDNRTRAYYRGAIATMLGMDDTERLPGVKYVDHPALRDPWPESNPVVVNISNEVNLSRNFTPLVEDAVDYWTSGEGAQHRNYSVDVSVQPDASNADVTVRFVENLGNCGARPIDTGYIGCADIYSGDRKAHAVSYIDIKGGYTDTSTRQTLIHEFGHLFGRQHGQQPMPEMNATFNATHLPLPDARERERPWLYDHLLVYMDLEAEESQSVWKDEIYEALNYIEQGADGAVPEAISYGITNNRSKADVVIEAVDMNNNTAWISRPMGTDPDDDGVVERITYHKVALNTEADARSVAYYTARALVYAWTEDYPESIEDGVDIRAAP